MAMACLNLSGKTHSRRERFMILVIGLRRTSNHSLIMKVGQRSNSYDLVGDLDGNLLTSSSVNGKRKEVGVCGGQPGLTRQSDTDY